MITRIGIEHFKSITSVEFDLDRINIFVGTNNSGKTSILQAIQFGCSVIQTMRIAKRFSKSKKSEARSIDPSELVYSPLKDVSALANGGKLRLGDKNNIRIKYINDEGDNLSVVVRKGKNKNILGEINISDLAEKFSSLEEPMCMFVPGLAGIPYNEEFRSEGIVRKAAAKGDANSVLRNILYLLKKNDSDWKSFIQELQSIFPSIDIRVDFNPQINEYIDARVIERSGSDQKELPIDAAGTGVLQAIQILSYIFLYKPKLLILDEPDAHLHPNNQREIMKRIFSLAKTRDFQLLISTHSRHVLDIAEEEAKVFWVHDGEIISEEYDNFKVLTDLGALDKGDLLKQGQIKCVVLTEDSKYEMLKNVLLASGFKLDETDVWAYKGCTKLDTAIALVDFIKEHAPAAKIVVHRDRDYMTDEEQAKYKNDLAGKTKNKACCAITEGSDIESYYLNASHVSEVYPEISLEEAQELITNAMNNCMEKSLTVFINSRVNADKNEKKKPANAGKISIECTKAYNSNPDYYRHGKTVINQLKDMIQNEKKLRPITLTTYSEYLFDRTLISIAGEIWGIK